MAAKFTPELLLNKAGGKIGYLMGALGTASMNGIYKLLNPKMYGFPSHVFDLRSDLADRLAKIAGSSPSSVRAYYLAEWKDSGKTLGKE